MAVLYLLSKAFLHKKKGLLLPLLFFNLLSPMYVRSSALNALLMDEAKNRNMTAGETAGARDNLRALAMVGAPLIYGGIYTRFRFKGATYFLGI